MRLQIEPVEMTILTKNVCFYQAVRNETGSAAVGSEPNLSCGRRPQKPTSAGAEFGGCDNIRCAVGAECDAVIASGGVGRD
jgi:hypothetical protein